MPWYEENPDSHPCVAIFTGHRMCHGILPSWNLAKLDWPDRNSKKVERNIKSIQDRDQCQTDPRPQTRTERTSQDRTTPDPSRHDWTRSGTRPNRSGLGRAAQGPTKPERTARAGVQGPPQVQLRRRAKHKKNIFWGCVFETPFWPHQTSQKNTKFQK